MSLTPPLSNCWYKIISLKFCGRWPNPSPFCHTKLLHPFPPSHPRHNFFLRNTSLHVVHDVIMNINGHPLPINDITYQACSFKLAHFYPSVLTYVFWAAIDKILSISLCPFDLCYVPSVCGTYVIWTIYVAETWIVVYITLHNCL